MKTEIDYSAVPGTSHLVDLDHTEDAVETEKGIVLIPTPSDDPNDPLNWSRSRKWLSMFCVVVYIFGGSVPGCCIYSILTNIAADPDIDITVDQLNDGTGYSFLFLGIGNLIMMPLAQQYGKRPVYLVSLLATVMFNLWQPYVHSNGQWIASKILNGVFFAPVESLPEITVGDLFFEHERATYMGVYSVALFGSNYMAPMLAGFVNDGLGWKWVIWMACIFGGACWVFLALFMEETNYTRKLRVRRDETGSIVAAITSRGEKRLDEKNPDTLMVVTSNEIGNQAALIDEQVEYPPIKTFWQKLSVTSGMRPENHLWDEIKAIFLMAQFPGVLYAGFLYGAALFWYSVLNGTEALILGDEPYNFSSAMCGLAYLSPVIFCLVIYPYCGWSTDWVKIHFAKKHNGVSQAEDRFWVLPVYMILGPAALILWGVGAAKGVHWFGVVFGLGLMAGLCTIGCVSAVTYILDSYEHMSAPAITVAILIRNTMNFAMDYGITPFVTNVGVQNCFIASAFICLFCIGTFFVMIFTGYYWRNKTKERYWKIVETYRAKVVDRTLERLGNHMHGGIWNAVEVIYQGVGENGRSRERDRRLSCSVCVLEGLFPVDLGKLLALVESNVGDTGDQLGQEGMLGSRLEHRSRESESSVEPLIPVLLVHVAKNANENSTKHHPWTVPVFDWNLGLHIDICRSSMAIGSLTFFFTEAICSLECALAISLEGFGPDVATWIRTSRNKIAAIATKIVYLYADAYDLADPRKEDTFRDTMKE
ncbi:hypothetical protein OGAPHI_004924 [Ogataea philodendri]|uniref:Major facilitator superfamily (MFS) profile domain-containing protein n=1 Tax=Ogataea philodendri TaxID=1378263 RepID=A0A9P8P0W8_9ASCO|nr:uncharacterized protein OGAPHI_004924 [Ogataea philodendri]KAH3663523.1 hypothetical protein OGAPHI_004924 [Ogataea philodendri]